MTVTHVVGTRKGEEPNEVMDKKERDRNMV